MFSIVLYLWNLHKHNEAYLFSEQHRTNWIMDWTGVRLAYMMVIWVPVGDCGLFYWANRLISLGNSLRMSCTRWQRQLITLFVVFNCPIQNYATIDYRTKAPTNLHGTIPKFAGCFCALWLWRIQWIHYHNLTYFNGTVQHQVWSTTPHICSSPLFAHYLLNYCFYDL